MDEQKDRTLKVPAEIRCNDLGEVEIQIEFLDEPNSLIRKVIEGKTVDESKSFICSFAIQTSSFRSYIRLGGLFRFVDKSDLVNSPEEINKRAMQALAEQLVKVSDNPCEYCANRDKCNAEAASIGETWPKPDTDVCARHVIHYFLSQAKND